jgi:hypothetical protein
LAESLNLHIKGSNSYVLRVEWNYDFSTNMAVLMTSQQSIQKLTKAIHTIVSHRMILSFGDKLCIGPHNLRDYQNHQHLAKRHDDTQRRAVK